ncbi:CTRL protease, partial [Corythaixoides concolor]|nr:CTRL protease [Corythaixoides concolor]
LGSALHPSAPPAGCGVPAVSPSVQYSERIINGRNAVPGPWPWQVSSSLFAPQTSSGSHFCSSSLIDENWVVTAAHCAFDPSSNVVVLREYDLGSNAESVQVKTVAKVVTDPGWNSDSLNNDMALLKLSSPAQLAPRASPASLALPATLRRVTTGWGRTGTACTYAAAAPSLPLISRRRCSQHWGNQTTSSMLCAGGIGTSSCQGDSGRPLVYQNGNTWTRVGIVSWGSSNCNVRTPAVYTRASRFRNRIPFATLQP